MYQKNYKSARALVYKGFSKFVGLDKNWTKAINLSEPFVSKNGQRLYPKRKAPANLPEPSDFTSKSSSFTPYTPFLGEKSSYLGWHWHETNNLKRTVPLRQGDADAV